MYYLTNRQGHWLGWEAKDYKSIKVDLLFDCSPVLMFETMEDANDFIPILKEQFSVEYYESYRRRKFLDFTCERILKEQDCSVEYLPDIKEYARNLPVTDMFMEGIELMLVEKLTDLKKTKED